MGMGDDSCLRGCRFEFQRCILDGHVSTKHIDLLKKTVLLAQFKQKMAKVCSSSSNL